MGKAKVQPVGLETAWFFYNCEHGGSNDPCPVCHPRDVVSQPDDWYETWVSPAPEGISDDSNLA